jgi:hypothetical protein
MKTKEEIIREAYGEHWEHVKDIKSKFFNNPFEANGWIIMEKYFYSNTKLQDLCEMSGGYARPKSLSGIENNNGWTKIESVEDLPHLFGDYHIVYKDTGDVSECCYHSLVTTQDRELQDKWWMDFVSHYQPIIKPKPPLY